MFAIFLVLSMKRQQTVSTHSC